MSGPLKIIKKPKLRDPYLIIGWDWPDAGRVGIDSVNFLTTRLGAKKLGMIEPRYFSSSPSITISKGVVKDAELLRNCFYYWKAGGSKRDLIIFESEQPSFRQYEFAKLIIDFSLQFGVKRIYTLGGINANIHHQQNSNIFSVVNKTELKKHLKGKKIELDMDYEGTTSMNGLLLWIAKANNIEAISLWASVPFYLSQLPPSLTDYPKASKEVLSILIKILDLPIDVKEMKLLVDYKNEEIEKYLQVGKVGEEEADGQFSKESSQTLH